MVTVSIFLLKLFYRNRAYAQGQRTEQFHGCLQHRARGDAAPPDFWCVDHGVSPLPDDSIYSTPVAMDGIDQGL